MKVDLRSVNLPSEMLAAVNYDNWLTTTPTLGAERAQKRKSVRKSDFKTKQD